MADDRPIDGPPEEIGRLTRELDELKAMVNARFARRPTGDIEPTIRATAKANTLLLQGQTISRTTYAGLWAWVQSNALVRPGLFTSGDNSTTFGLPNFSGRVPIGVGTLGTDTYALGALVGEARHVLTAAEMPSHNHSGTTAGVGDHDHLIGAGGLHNGHTSQSNVDHPTGTGYLHGHPPSWGNNNGNHGHPMDWNGGHDHGFTTSSAGSGTAHENRQPSIAIGWLIWV